MEYIDSHSHLHTFSWNELELLAITGLKAVVAPAGNPAVQGRIYKPPLSPQDVFGLWDHPILLSKFIETRHFFKFFVAIGIHSLGVVGEIEKVLEKIPEYLRKDEVVALGEIGIDPIQYFGKAWPLDQQAEVIKAQLKIAKEYDFPVIIHTPVPKLESDFWIDLAFSDTEKLDSYKRKYIEMDLKIINEVGLDHKRVVIDHVDPSVIDFVLKETKAYIGVSIGLDMRRLWPKDVARAIAECDPERIMLNSDIANHAAYVDLFLLHKTIREMIRLKMKDEDIRKVIFENAKKFYGLKLE